MKDSRLRLSQVISLFSWLGFSFPLSFPSLPSAPLLRGVTAKFLLLMRHSWAHGPKDIHAGNELENTWPPVSFPQDNLPFPALLGVLPFLFQWPSYQSSRKKKKSHCSKLHNDFCWFFSSIHHTLLQREACEVTAVGCLGSSQALTYFSQQKFPSFFMLLAWKTEKALRKEIMY